MKRIESAVMSSLVNPLAISLILSLIISLSACIPAPTESRLSLSEEQTSDNEPSEEQTSGDEPSEEQTSGEMSGQTSGEMSSQTSGEMSEAGDAPQAPTCDVSEGPERAWTGVITEIKFGREEPTGVSLGQDIDGRVSDAGDAESCFRPDMTSPDGVEGIDNQFAKILPLVEAVGGEAIEGLVQGIINQGTLLLMFELLALDDPTLTEDDCMLFNFFYGLGVPQINAEGVIISGQSFDRDPERPSLSVEGVTLSDRIFEVSGLSFELPLQVFDQFYVLDLSRVTIHGEFGPEGELSGYLSGVIDVDAVAARVEQIEGGGMVAALVPGFLRQQADLDPDEDGVCHSLSVTLTFKSKRAYLFQ